MFGGIYIDLNIPGTTDIIAVAIVCIVIAIVIIIVWMIRVKKIQKKGGQNAEETPADEIFKLVSRVKYPVRSAPQSGEAPAVTTKRAEPDPEKSPKKIDVIKNRVNITESLQALSEKYSVLEITLATDDGLVLASSAGRDVQADAAKFSQIVRQQRPPDEHGVTLFELRHRESSLVGIVRTDKEIPPNWKKGIREDTKGILQWWL
jgi:hypothetical protein